MDKDLKIYSPRLFVRFGIDKYYSNWSVNFEIENNGCEGLKEFKQFLKDFEKRIKLDEINLEKYVEEYKGVTYLKINYSLKKYAERNYYLAGWIMR